MGFIRINYLIIFILIIFLTFVGVANAETTNNECIKNCENNFGENNINKNKEVLSDNVINLCGGVLTQEYQRYKKCLDETTNEFKECQQNCEFYRTDPCYGECEQNYKICINECSNELSIKKQVCTEIYLDECYNPCTSGCDKNRGVACVKNTCVEVENAKPYLRKMCSGKNVGDRCCEQPKTGDATPYCVEKREEEVERDWSNKRCNWKIYEWRAIAPYDIQTCTYNWDKKITQKVLVDSGSSQGFFQTLFCGFTSHSSSASPGFDYRDEFTVPSATCPKG